ncbi:MAG: hypothetical protein ACLT8E_00420 [Akkermansia sp.]
MELFWPSPWSCGRESRSWSGMDSIKTRNPNMWTLIGAGTSIAFLYSLAATIVPGWFPAVFIHDGHVPVYYEAAAIISSPQPSGPGAGTARSGRRKPSGP